MLDSFSHGSSEVLQIQFTVSRFSLWARPEITWNICVLCGFQGNAPRQCRLRQSKWFNPTSWCVCFSFRDLNHHSIWEAEKYISQLLNVRLNTCGHFQIFLFHESRKHVHKMWPTVGLFRNGTQKCYTYQNK